jgi:hypothetical protein
MTDTDSAARDRAFNALPTGENEEPATAPEPPVKRSMIDLPDGAVGIFFLLIIAALSGGLIAVYWPWQQSGTEASATADRLADLEARIDQIAIGHAPKAAQAAFQDERRDLGALKTRLDADEARLGAMEKATGQIGDVDLGALKNNVEKSTADVAVLSDRIARLEQGGEGGRVVATGLHPTDPSLVQLRKELNDRSQALNDSVAKLAGRTAALERNAPPEDLAARLDSFALKSGEAALEARIGKLEGEDMTGTMRRAAAVLALADLVRASDSAEPFASELGALKALVPHTPAVSDLSRYARAGVPTRAMLAERFSQNAGTIVAAERIDKAQSWGARLWANLMNTFSIRRVGNVPGGDVDATVARAEVELHAGDLDRAVVEMNALKGSARAAADDWLGDARGRLAVDRDTQALATEVIASLATQTPPSAPLAGPPGAGPGK